MLVVGGVAVPVPPAAAAAAAVLAVLVTGEDVAVVSVIMLLVLVGTAEDEEVLFEDAVGSVLVVELAMVLAGVEDRCTAGESLLFGSSFTFTRLKRTINVQE